MPDPLLDAFVELHRHLAECEPVDVVLQRVAEIVATTMGRSGGVSITVSEHGDFRTAASTIDAAVEVDQAQYDSDMGPCLEAHRLGHVVEVPDMHRASKWPEFRQSAIEHGFGSSLSLPLSIGSEKLGALNCYSSEASPYGPDLIGLGRGIATQASVALSNLISFKRLRDLVDQLEEALESRDVIGQAKGILMNQQRITAEKAFGLLVSTSQRRNVKLRMLAEEVATTGVLVES
ncbi:MAG: Response regulator with antiterminator output domain [Acidimicrobiales bacterium]|nr:Response regulator with antiterminator output domain [Acidimicrobiales bacterium]